MRWNFVFIVFFFAICLSDATCERYLSLVASDHYTRDRVIDEERLHSRGRQQERICGGGGLRFRRFGA